MKLLTIPVPGADLTVASTFPKKMYLSLEMVGASPALLIVNSAPFEPYDKVVPSAKDQSELAPVVQSVERVVPRAGSEGHVATPKSEQLQRWRGNNLLLSRGLQSVKVCALAT